MPKLLDFQNFCENLQEITTTKIMNKKKFHPEGLFSEQIFGPMKNYTCQCGTYYGISKSGNNCEICKVDIVNSNERRKRFAKIILPIPVINPIFYDLLIVLGGSNLKGALTELMKNDKSILYLDEDEHVITTNSELIPKNKETWEGLNAIQKIIKDLANNLSEEIADWKLIKNNLDKLIINQIIVLPPDLRPAAKGIKKNNQIVDKINRFYMQILTKKESMKNTIIDIRTNKKLYYIYFKQLQKDVNELYHHILEKMSKKEGLIRGNILGKRIDFSGRAVITPEPTLKIDECILPYKMVLEIFKLQISKKLIEIGKFKLLNKAISFIDECIENSSPVLFDLCKLIIKDEVCILNRQPSLHRIGMLGFKIKISLDSVIKIHPMICAPLNADFDGDCIAVYVPISEEAKQEIKDKIFITKNLSSPANGSLSTIPTQDIILGIYALTTNNLPDYKNIIKYKNENISKGEVEFNKCLPEDYPVVFGKVDKKRLLEILNDIKNLYPIEEITKTLDKIKRIGFKFATLFGTTMVLNECVINESNKICNEIYSSDNIIEQLNKFSNNDITEFLKKNFKYAYMLESGARGSWEQIKQMILTRGFISNFDGEILETPIKHSLIEGLDEKEFFNSTYGCRKGLLDVALNTGVSGYLSRKLIFTCANLQLGNSDDCGTTDCLEVFINTKRKAKMLIGRFYIKNNILIQIKKEDVKNLLGQTIQLRSPILCKNKNICHKCYGNTYEELHSKYIGIIAAQTLGERGTQLILRTFHFSGSAIINNEKGKNTDMKQKDIVADLSTISKLLHKFKGKTYKEITSELFDVYSHNQDIYHIHFECIVAQLMWYKHKKWRLYENRNELVPEYFSIQSTPSQESWILGLSFSNPKRHILKGLLNKGNYKGIIDKILIGERIT